MRIKDPLALIFFGVLGCIFLAFFAITIGVDEIGLFQLLWLGLSGACFFMALWSNSDFKRWK